MALRVGLTTFGYLYQASLQSTLESIARAGYELTEIMPLPPHLAASDFDWIQRRQLRRLLSDLGLTCVSINANELNLISPTPELRSVALRQYCACIELAHDLGAQLVNVIAGRQGTLQRIPQADAIEISTLQLARLLEDAHRCGIDLAIETPHRLGFMDSTRDLAALVRTFDDPRLGICFDVANMHAYEDIPTAVANVGPWLKMAHLSDTWRHRYAHTSIGRGEVDFPEYAAALEEQGFSGPCIYELLDGEDPDPRVGTDLEKLKSWGWTS